MDDPRFRRRACPMCGHRGELLVTLEADQFCRVNWTYRADYREVLHLPERAEFPIERCTLCGFVFAGFLPDEGFLNTVYEIVIDHASCIDGSENRASYARRLRYLAQLLELTRAESPRLLDFGSGAGVTLRIAASAGINSVGFDPSNVRRTYAEERTVVVSSADEVANHGPFDLIVLDNVLEHVPDPRETMRLIRSWAAGEAVAFVSVPGYEPAFLEQQLRAARNGTPIDMTLNPWEHLNYFSRTSLDALMERAGFRRLPLPDIGLRREAGSARVRNAAASFVRLLRWMTSGQAVESAEYAFYGVPL